MDAWYLSKHVNQVPFLAVYIITIIYNHILKAEDNKTILFYIFY